MLILIRLGQGLIFLFLIFLLSLNSCMTFRTTDAKVTRYFEKRGVEVTIHRKAFQDGIIRYIETGGNPSNNSSSLIVFVHGAPGSSNNFHGYLADSMLRQHARMISIDRLGYGFSNYGRSEVSIARQSEQVRFVMEQYQADRVILVGHSFGGPIIAKCAVDRPQNIAGIIMLAPVNDPDSEVIFWFSHFARWKASRWLLSGSLKVSGDEKFAHIEELRKMADDWKMLRVPVVHIHGDKDFLAPPASNIAFSEKNVPAEFLKMIVLDGTGHFIPWTDYDVVHQELMTLLLR